MSLATLPRIPRTCDKMTGFRDDVKAIRSDHPLFFWGLVAVVVILFGATVAMAARIPLYRSQAAAMDGDMSQTERDMRDRILDSRARRSDLAVALMQRELRLAAMEEDTVHLALSLEDSTLTLRHGGATLRESRVTIGADSTVQAPDGRTWRLVRPLGERHVADKEVEPVWTVPEWVYVAQGQPVPPEDQRQVPGGLGEFLLRLDDGTEIHTRPSAGPFATGVKPAGFVVEDEDAMRAIFDAITAETPVYIY